ncbi:MULTISPECIES: VOC family protein [Rhizobium]|uniref:Catechol 2,3-dioxygenase-like lactoylglutathione lyase family enzyme n=1 Tax=Rhizobium esperanzae TaxID=1967781 RepID=A0A7W6UKM4_9HYPH|nr:MULTISPECIES: VOC family protein [Rhizobium]MBB4439962.1 catechol 2,3-dioxygenase-like lactoylglutathione lyase family enzyme [Rhizobium esperanzae]MDH6202471.1 catechol 2,3-dioxygenase-like lactoylglutathione lyase family enzyme [Rhizobium leguminosarum]OAV54456.1 bleomycin resistance protein [Rhizobium sp. WYCCWR10014]
MSRHVSRLHHVGIVVQNLEASVTWYLDHLGFEHQSSFNLPGAEVAMIARGHARLELFQVEGAAPMADQQKELETVLNLGGVNHFALVVEDLDGTVAALAAKGVEIVISPSRVPDQSGDRFAYIRDNERMFVELYQSAS